MTAGFPSADRTCFLKVPGVNSPEGLAEPDARCIVSSLPRRSIRKHEISGGQQYSSARDQKRNRPQPVRLHRRSERDRAIPSGDANVSARQALFASAAFGIAMFAAGGPAQLNAQQPPAPQTASPAVQIDGDDIGGVVTSRFGPEAGVWVIAETTRARHPLRQDGGHRRASAATSSPICRRPSYRRVGARLWPGRLAQGRRRSPARSST